MLFNKVVIALAICAGMVDVSLAAQQEEGRGSRGRHSRFNASQSIAPTSLASSMTDTAINTATTATAAAAVNETGSAAFVAASATASAGSGNNNVRGGGRGGNKKLALNPSLVQIGSQNSGVQESGAETGQTPSATYVFLNLSAMVKI